MLNLKVIPCILLVAVLLRISRVLLDQHSWRLYEHVSGEWSVDSRNNHLTKGRMERRKEGFAEGSTHKLRELLTARKVVQGANATGSCLVPPFYVSFVSCGNFPANLPTTVDSTLCVCFSYLLRWRCRESKGRESDEDV